MHLPPHDRVGAGVDGAHALPVCALQPPDPPRGVHAARPRILFRAPPVGRVGVSEPRHRTRAPAAKDTRANSRTKSLIWRILFKVNYNSLVTTLILPINPVTKHEHPQKHTLPTGGWLRDFLASVEVLLRAVRVEGRRVAAHPLDHRGAVLAREEPLGDVVERRPCPCALRRRRRSVPLSRKLTCAPRPPARGQSGKKGTPALQRTPRG